MGKDQQIISEYWQNKFHALHKKGFSRAMDELQIESWKFMKQNSLEFLLIIS